MRARLVGLGTVGLLGLAGLLLTGCGAGARPRVPDVLGAQRLGEMAEAQLESEHPDLAAGTTTCANLDFRVGASARCVRTAVLSGGRQIRVLGTVRVISTANGGRLHVQLDDRVAEFGAPEEYVAQRVRDEVVRRYAVRPDEVSCPYLSGPVGTSVQCQVRFGEDYWIARPTVVRVAPEQYRTVVGFPDGVLPARINPYLDSQLRQLKENGYGVDDS